MRIGVLGGGALGCGAALALARDHEVTLLERATLGAGSSAKAAGILSSFSWNDADYRLIAETRGAIGELISLALAAGERAARGAWRPTGSVVVASGAATKSLDQLQDRVERHTEECLRLDWRAAMREFPGVAFRPGDEAIVAQEDGVIEAGDFLAAMRARLEQEGATVQESSKLTLTEAQRRFDAVVVAGGAWTKGLLAPAGIRLPLQAYRTQLASLAIPDAAELPIVHDLDLHFYARPEADASILAGNGTQLRPFDPDSYNEVGDPEFVHSIAERVVTRFTNGAEGHVRSSWAGLCVATPDKRPLCGAVPGHDGLFILTGDNGFGLMRSLALGERMADAVARRPHKDLDPGRFGPDARDDFAMREGYGSG